MPTAELLEHMLRSSPAPIHHGRSVQGRLLALPLTFALLVLLRPPGVPLRLVCICRKGQGYVLRPVLILEDNPVEHIVPLKTCACRTTVFTMSSLKTEMGSSCHPRNSMCVSFPLIYE
jgi:hypothetical protein